jgi:hypothetical protein
MLEFHNVVHPTIGQWSSCVTQRALLTKTKMFSMLGMDLCLWEPSHVLASDCNDFLKSAE